MQFSKPSLTIPEQISLLESRGMSIPDHNSAAHYLKHISYYRLRAYWFPLEHDDSNGEVHKFAEETSIDDVIALYVFDRQLRLLVMDAIESIEVSMRGAWAYHLATKYGSHSYLDSEIYGNIRYEKVLFSLREEIDRSKDTFIRHYKRKYSDPADPPIWMISEIMSLGQLSKWFGDLRHRYDRNAISKPYGLDERFLVSFIHHLAVIRNICAHHSRLWNRSFQVTMVIPNYPASLKLAMNPSELKLIYNSLATIGYLIGIIAPETEWRTRLKDLMSNYPQVDCTSMGFPDDWQSMPVWKLD